MVDVTQWLRLFRKATLPMNEEQYAAIDARNKKYLQLLHEESHACRVYYALQSQGKYCPADKLEEAWRYMRLTERLTSNYVYHMNLEAKREENQKKIDRTV